MRTAEDFYPVGGDAEMKAEFTSFCRMLLLLLKSEQIEEVKKELEKIISENEK